jgi:transposase
MGCVVAVKRYELNEAQWSRIAALLPGKVSDPGRTGSDGRLFVNGCPWVLRSGTHWCDLPERCGIGKSNGFGFDAVLLELLGNEFEQSAGG